MSLTYLPEHADNARLALNLAEREAAHLAYTHRTLYALSIDLAWVRSLSEREDLAEKLDAFVGRFGRLQDHIGDKLLPRFSALVGAQPKSLLDLLAYAERMNWLESAEEFIGVRKLRNLLVHEYMSSEELFFEALQSADSATKMLLDVVAGIQNYAQQIGLRHD